MRGTFGQTITFSIEIDADQKYREFIRVRVKAGDTVQKVAARRGNPEDARLIADLNGIRSVTSKFSGRGIKELRVPGTLRAADRFDVYAGDEPPRITDGYALFDTVGRPGRTGLTQFTGYNPIAMEVPIRFEADLGGRGDREGVPIEAAINLLESMAGRGVGQGGVGPPPVIRVSTTDNTGKVIPLIAHNYQWSKQNPSAPMWRVAGIDWDPAPLRNSAGNRIRQLATVTLQQHVRTNLIARSAAERSKARNSSRARR